MVRSWSQTETVEDCRNQRVVVGIVYIDDLRLICRSFTDERADTAEQPDHMIANCVPDVIIRALGLAYRTVVGIADFWLTLSSRGRTPTFFVLAKIPFFIWMPPFRTEISLVDRLSESPSRLIGYKLDKSSKRL